MAKILLLEDDESLNRGISLKLTKEGYEVLSAAGVSEAKKLLSETQVALVISDITMEDGDGLTFCRELRQKSNVYIIFLTALDQEVAQQKGASASDVFPGESKTDHLEGADLTVSVGCGRTVCG